MSAPSVVVTGAAAGIGRSTALLFARRGYRVGAVDIDRAGLESLAEESAPITTGQIVTGILDVTDAEEWSRTLAEFCVDGRLDILVNNAGLLSSGPFEDTPVSRHRQIIDVNITGVVLGCHAAFPYLRDTPGAQIVNMCSASALYGQPDLATYSATKFAVRGLTEALELEWAHHDIKVQAMWPLFVDTHMVDGMDIGARRSLGVNLGADDVARAVFDATRPGRRSARVHRPVGRQATLLSALAQISPGWANRLVNRRLTGH
ncbi:SDR family oxidoreductase [Rhodococcus sp. NPDC047139]|uniref:SDR family oxidoreductase n=1 Tax=Rhodococcus sp. NPDC047139 TaxID=3155141 RepID=UPI0033EB337B